MKAAGEPCFRAALEGQVLPFRAGGQWYAVALERVERLCDLRQLAEAGAPAVSLQGHTGGALAVLLRGREGLFGLLADEAEPILSVPPEERLPLPKLLQGEKSMWLSGAFYWAEKRTLYFLLCCDQLEPRKDAG